SRDIPTGTVSGKRTLAVRLGDTRARRVYGAFIALTLGFAVAAFIALGNFAGGATLGAGAGLLGLLFGAWALVLATRVLRSRAERIPTRRDTVLVQLGIGADLLLAGLLWAGIRILDHGLLDHGILRGHVFIALTRLFLPVRDLLEPLRGLISLGGEEDVCEQRGDDDARSCEEHPTHSREEQQGADDHE